MGGKQIPLLKTFHASLGAMIDDGGPCVRVGCYVCETREDVDLEALASEMGRDACLVGWRPRCGCGEQMWAMWSETANGFLTAIPMERR